jgi:RNA polymerase sigma-70 factor (ECF subfamily)
MRASPGQGATVENSALGAELSDHDLLVRARAGDTSALELLIVRYQPRVFRYGLSMCRDADAAGDIAQETLMAMARSIGDFRGESSVGSWLFTIARRFCMRKRRRHKHAPAEEQSLETLGPADTQHLSDPSPGPEQEAAAHEIQTALTAAIDALDPAQREVLVLRDVEGLTAPEVAQVLGVSVDAVKSRLHRARVAVRQQMTPLLTGRSPQCPDVLTTFSRHLEGEIAPEVCAQMEAHLERCAHCRGTCDSLKRTLAGCRALGRTAVPARVADSVKTALRAFLQRNER